MFDFAERPKLKQPGLDEREIWLLKLRHISIPRKKYRLKNHTKCSFLIYTSDVSELAGKTKTVIRVYKSSPVSTKTTHHFHFKVGIRTTHPNAQVGTVNERQDFVRGSEDYGSFFSCGSRTTDRPSTSFSDSL